MGPKYIFTKIINFITIIVIIIIIIIAIIIIIIIIIIAIIIIIITSGETEKLKLKLKNWQQNSLGNHTSERESLSTFSPTKSPLERAKCALMPDKVMIKSEFKFLPFHVAVNVIHKPTAKDLMNPQ